MKEIKKILRRQLQQLGFDIIRRTPRNCDDMRIQQLLRTHGIDIVIDVGANEGQYGLSLREAGYAGEIVSFEPLSEAYKKLKQRANSFDLWRVAPRSAIGRECGEITINVANNSTSSSVLDMLDTHVSAAPQSKYISQERVPICTLDSVYSQYLDDSANAYLKIDTQGYESEVLDGAELFLDKVKGIQIELSLVPLYEGQTLYMELIKRFTDRGFQLYALTPGFTDMETGQLLQMDGIFFKS